MMRKFYQYKKPLRRLLSETEIARACCISVEKVHDWFSADLLGPVQGDSDLVDAVEVVSFLVRGNLPVASSLLPPRTRKLLFIVADAHEFATREAKIDHICRSFTDSSGILAEISVAGRPADLSILTLAPDMVLIFLRSYNKSTVNTFNLLSSLPECRIVLFVDDATKDVIDSGQISLPAHLIVRDSLPLKQLTARLCGFFAGGVG